MPYQATTPTSSQVGILHVGSTPLQVQQAAVSITSSGTIVAAPPAGYKIALVQLFLVASAAVTVVNLQSHTTTGIATGGVSLPAAGSQLVLPFSPATWLTCVPGEALDLEFTGTATLAGSVNYVIMPATPF